MEGDAVYDREPAENWRLKLLRNASLVSTRWKVEATKVLWRNLDIDKDETAKLLMLSSAFGSHQTTFLKLRGPCDKEDGVTSTSVHGILGGVKGVRHFELWCFDELAGLSVDVLFYPNLASEFSFTVVA